MKTTRTNYLRRSLLIASAAGASQLTLTANGKASSKQALRLTPAQTEGPYYPVREPKDADYDLLRTGERAYAKGTPTWVQGRVLDQDGNALKGGVIEIWQCDEAGHYDHPADGAKMDPSFQGFGRITLDAQGSFRFRTIKPAPYTGRTPHIHAKVKLGKFELLTTQFYVKDDPGNARDGIWRRMKEEDRALVTMPFVRVNDGLQADYSVVVQA
jgi:protocatechuate 3,4-dioxygenase, beta subunit